MSAVAKLLELTVRRGVQMPLDGKQLLERVPHCADMLLDGLQATVYQLLGVVVAAYLSTRVDFVSRGAPNVHSIPAARHRSQGGSSLFIHFIFASVDRCHWQRGASC